MNRVLIALLLAGALGGCTLVDQRVVAKWFNTTPPPPPPKPVVSGALVTIQLGQNLENDLPAVHQAVTEALSRKPDVQFDVVTVVPAVGTPADQVTAAEAVTADARTVARTINADGVDDDRIHLAARAEQGVTSRQIEIFVR